MWWRREAKIVINEREFRSQLANFFQKMRVVLHRNKNMLPYIHDLFPYTQPMDALQEQLSHARQLMGLFIYSDVNKAFLEDKSNPAYEDGRMFSEMVQSSDASTILDAEFKKQKDIIGSVNVIINGIIEDIITIKDRVEEIVNSPEMFALLTESEKVYIKFIFVQTSLLKMGVTGVKADIARMIKLGEEVDNGGLDHINMMASVIADDVMKEDEIKEINNTLKEINEEAIKAPTVIVAKTADEIVDGDPEETLTFGNLPGFKHVLTEDEKVKLEGDLKVANAKRKAIKKAKLKEEENETKKNTPK